MVEAPKGRQLISEVSKDTLENNDGEPPGMSCNQKSPNIYLMKKVLLSRSNGMLIVKQIGTDKIRPQLSPMKPCILRTEISDRHDPRLTGRRSTCILV